MKKRIEAATGGRLAAPLVVLVSVCLFGCETAPAADPVAAEPEVNYEGLETVRSRRLDIVQVRPGVDFAAYTGVLLREPELAFQTPDRGERQFPLSEAQKDRFRNMLATEFEKELGKLDSLDLVTESGSDVVALSIRVQDIAVTVSAESLGRVGRAAAVLEASADATVVLELKDSLSNEILARGVDTRSVEGAAMRQHGDTMVTRFEAAEKVVEKWAATARTALDALTSSR
jgi:hypothetical protein